ncbi:MAG: hypothetical protein ABIF12_01185 [bacterium]
MRFKNIVTIFLIMLFSSVNITFSMSGESFISDAISLDELKLLVESDNFAQRLFGLKLLICSVK